MLPDNYKALAAYREKRKHALRNVRLAELWAWISREARDDENLPQTAKRLLIDAAMEEYKYVKDAAKALRISSGALTLYRHRQREKRIDSKLEIVKGAPHGDV